MIKMDFETWEVVNRIHLANFKIQWQALLNTVMKDWMKILEFLDRLSVCRHPKQSAHWS